jgi:hypothetical protein
MPAYSIGERKEPSTRTDLGRIPRSDIPQVILVLAAHPARIGEVSEFYIEHRVVS